MKEVFSKRVVTIYAGEEKKLIKGSLGGGRPFDHNKCVEGC